MKYFIANPYSLLLALADVCIQKEYYLVVEKSEHRKSGRSLVSNFEMCISIFHIMKIAYTEVSLNEAILTINNSPELITVEQRLVSDAKSSIKTSSGYVSEKIEKKVRALTYAADILLAAAPFYNYLYGPRQIITTHRWKLFVKNQEIEEFVFPDLRIKPRQIMGARTSFISRQNFQQIVQSIIQSDLDFEINLTIQNLTKPMIVIAPDSSIGIKHTNEIKRQYELLSKKYSEYPVLIKPHPGSNFSDAELLSIEKSLDILTLNSIYQISNVWIKAIPIEFLLATNEQNLYLGVRTAGIAFLNREKVFLVSTGDKFFEKMQRINYREFFRRW